ncbi:hypothetical protein NPIL_417251 [Nephila pilipes]|uniref:Protein kinase domain-containing protein n=1 Tax=Nephila pilipes TaxID=299642 RepID=A0A8X6IPF4_NEPPI|nr:hypothetical protein NPIL_417251 [Nephila pilipes]
MDSSFTSRGPLEKSLKSPTRLPLRLLQLGDPYGNKRDNLLKQATAYHLSPFEAVATRYNRAREFKLTPPPKDSYLHNQSLPDVHKDPENGNASFDMGEIHKCTIDKFRGDTLSSINFSPLKTSPRQVNGVVNNRHVNGSSPLVETIEVLSGNVFLRMQNTNKAIVTINAETTEILTANTLATQLLGIGNHYTSIKLSDFILSPEDQFLFSESDLNPSGELVLFSGKVMDLMNSAKQIVPVSVWARKIESDSDFRCVVVMEPVERITAAVKFDHNGKIVSCDENFISVFGFSDPEAVINSNITDLIPNVEFGLENKQVNCKQCITGRNGGFIFPLSIQVNLCSKEKLNEDHVQEVFYEGTVWVFSNISGLITLLPDGTIHSCNTNFSLLFFGYTQDELVGKNISFLIPSFYNENEYFDTDSVALPPFDDDDDSSAKCGTSDGRTTADSIGTEPPRPMNPIPFSPYMRDDYHKMFSYSSFGDGHSASSSQLSFNQPSPIDQSSQQLECDYLKSSACTPPLVEKPSEDTNSSEHELSASSLQHSRHLSYSESQDTLHSGTNSITGSDINANFYGSGDGRLSFEAVNNTPSECSYNPSEDSSHEPDSSSESGDEEESSREDKDDQYSFCSHESDSDKEDKESFLIPSNMSLSELNSLSCKEHTHSTSLSDCDLKYTGLMTRISTPRDVNARPLSDNSSRSLEGGEHIGLGRHRDGTNIAIIYYLKKVTLDNGKHLHCLWVSHDPEEIKEASPISKARNDNVRTHTQETAQTKSDRETSSCSETSESSLLSDSVYIEGDFSDKYTIIEHLRKGAFGCIKRTYRNSDGLLVIAKFIRKSEVYDDSWVDDNLLNKKVPLEISILNAVDHPNIVKVLDVFENDMCFQMIMEKHGNGLDLFEFIERHPKMDEPLASYIFRQVVSALSYLHDLSILHRDIKDENLIIDQKFHVKLIDFGSAAFMEEGKLFSTFCGTMEYCSPEVIRGNKYQGPELEMFALGVTLYTLLAGENPFIGADEILIGEYDVPSKWSEELVSLVAHLLEPDPQERATLPQVENNSWVNQPVCIKEYEFDDVVYCETEDMHPVKYFKDLNIKSESSETTTDSDASFLSSKMSSVKLEDMRRSLTESEL